MGGGGDLKKNIPRAVYKRKESKEKVDVFFSLGGGLKKSLTGGSAQSKYHSSVLQPMKKRHSKERGEGQQDPHNQSKTM